MQSAVLAIVNPSVCLSAVAELLDCPGFLPLLSLLLLTTDETYQEVTAEVTFRAFK